MPHERTPNRVIAEMIVKLTSKLPFTRAVVLLGSRAIGTALESSDYDLVVVVPTPFVVYSFLKLKELEQKLTDQGIKATLNPLATWLLSSYRENLFVWKVLQEGKVLYGKRPLKDGTLLKPHHVKPTWYLLTVANSMHELLKVLTPSVIKNLDSLTELKAKAKRRILRGAAKSIVLTAQSFVLPYGYYSRPSVIRQLLLSRFPKKEVLEERGVIKALSESQQILVQKNYPLDRCWQFLRDAVDYALLAYETVVNLYGTPTNGVLYRDYFQSFCHWSKLKVLEYVLFTLFGKDFNFRPLIYDCSIVEVIRGIQLALIQAIDWEQYELTERPLIWAAELTDKYINRIKKEDNREVLWCNVRERILDRWEMANSVLGVV